MTITPLQQEKIDSLFRKYMIKFAYIFGSSVTGNFINSSDIDIAVYLEDAPKKKSSFVNNERFDIRLKLIGELSKIFSREIDLVIINDIQSVFFKYVIISEGRLIYEIDKSFRVEKECRIYDDYFDFKPFLEEYHKNFLNKKIYA